MYHVFYSPEGEEEYLGEATSLRAARRLAAQHGRGKRNSLPAWMYDTARAAGSCMGLSAPPPVEEPTVWCGRGRNYAVCREAE